MKSRLNSYVDLQIRDKLLFTGDIMEEVLKVRMLGKLVISYKGKSIVYSDQRSRKAWSVLAYLLVNRGRNIEGQEIIDICWSGDDLIDDPANALKSLFYRIRTMLDKLEPGFGKTLIVRNGGQTRVLAQCL